MNFEKDFVLFMFNIVCVFNDKFYEKWKVVVLEIEK